MAYSRKTWVDRESEYPTRRILTNTSSGTETQVTVTRDEGTVSVAGDSFDAQTMNNMEDRIASEFTNQGAAIGTLSNLTTLDKTDLVSAINEVKSDIPVIPTIPQNLDDLGDVNKPAGGVLDGSVPCWDVTHSEYDIRLPDASEITYDSTTSQPTGTVGDAVQDLQAEMTNEIARIDALYDEKANLASPAFTGSPTAPTASVGHSGTRIATTAFVNNEIDNDTKFHKNDTVDLTPAVFAGSIGSDKKTIHFTIPLNKPLGSDITGVTTGGNFSIYTPSGAIFTSSTLASKGTVTHYLREYGIGVRLVLSTAYSTGSTPVSVYCNASNSMTFTGS